MTKYLILFIGAGEELRMTLKLAESVQDAVDWFTSHRNYGQYRIVGINKLPSEHLHIGLLPVREPKPTKVAVLNETVTLDWFGG